MIIDAPCVEQIPSLRALWKEAFGDSDAFLDTFFATAFRTERCRCITIEHQVVAALYWFHCEYGENRIAYVYAIATAKSYRGQGLCRALMNDTHALLQKQGYAGAVLVPGEASLFDFYRKIGYETCSTVSDIHCEAAENPVAVRRIDKETYAQLRRQFLPDGSVIQERENLDFLETGATLWAGDHVLLAARTDQTVLHGIELLGDATCAAGLITALGCQTGVFRTPGPDRPFAMYLPLKPGPSPRYFGLAFD